MKPPPAAVLAAAFLAGGAALGHEIVWSRLLALWFNSSLAAAALVTAFFLAGLALGAGLLARRAGRLARPGAAYAGLQLLLGAAASAILAAHAWFVLPLGGGPSSALARWLIAPAAILPATILMGACFPAAAALLGREAAQAPRRLALLYAAETAGGAAGALGAAFLLLGWLGLPGTVFCCAGLNTAAGLLVLAAGGWRPGAGPEQPAACAPPPPAPPAAGPDGPAPALRLLALLAAGSGLCALIYEISWTRLLSLFVDNNTQGFALLLAGFLGGGAGGALLAGRASGKPRLRRFAAAQLGLAVLGGVFAASLHLLHLLGWVFEPLLPGGGQAARAVAGALLVAAPAALCGASLSLLLGAARAGNQDPSRAQPAGAVYAANTAGAVGGALAAAFLLVPLAGSAWAAAVAAAGNLLLGAAALGGPQGRSLAWLVAAPLFGVAGLAPQALESVFGLWALPPAAAQELRAGGRLLLRREGLNGTVTVVSLPGTNDGAACFVDNNSVIAAVYDNLKTVGLQGHLPFVFRPASQRALVIGYGTGVTARAVLAHEGMREAVCAEICGGVLQAGRFFSRLNGQVARDPRLTLLVADGRQVLRDAPAGWDAVICDPVHPRLGSNPLFTAEFYALARRRLAPGGVLVAYLPFHDLDANALRRQVRTFLAAFPASATLWFAAGHGVLVGVNGPERPAAPGLEQLFAAPAGRREMARCGLPNLPSLLGCFVAGAAALAAFAGEGDLNSDYHPAGEFACGRLDRDWRPANLLAVADLCRPAGEGLRLPSALQLLARELAPATALKIRARARQEEGDRAGARRLLLEAKEINPDDPEIDIFLAEINRPLPPL